MFNFSNLICYLKYTYRIKDSKIFFTLSYRSELLSLDYKYLLGIIAKYTYKVLHHFLLLERWLEKYQIRDKMIEFNTSFPDYTFYFHITKVNIFHCFK